MMLAVGVTLLVVAIVIALALRLSRRPARDAVGRALQAERDERAAQMTEDVAPALQSPVVEEPQPAPTSQPDPAVTWTAALTPTVLDETARRRLIDDLALLAAPWAIELLHRAHHEESSPQLRAYIETALASPEAANRARTADARVSADSRPGG